MDALPDTNHAMRKLQAAVFIPVLLAFIVGSLPLLLPLFLYRSFGGASAHG